jgi:hypothetical protein
MLDDLSVELEAMRQRYAWSRKPMNPATAEAVESVASRFYAECGYRSLETPPVRMAEVSSADSLLARTAVLDRYVLTYKGLLNDIVFRMLAGAMDRPGSLEHLPFLCGSELEQLPPHEYFSKWEEVRDRLSAYLEGVRRQGGGLDHEAWRPESRHAWFCLFAAQRLPICMDRRTLYLLEAHALMLRFVAGWIPCEDFLLVLRHTDGN